MDLGAMTEQTQEMSLFAPEAVCTLLHWVWIINGQIIILKKKLEAVGVI